MHLSVMFHEANIFYFCCYAFVIHMNYFYFFGGSGFFSCHGYVHGEERFNFRSFCVKEGDFHRMYSRNVLIHSSFDGGKSFLVIDIFNLHRRFRWKRTDISLDGYLYSTRVSLKFLSRIQKSKFLVLVSLRICALAFFWFIL